MYIVKHSHAMRPQLLAKGLWRKGKTNGCNLAVVMWRGKLCDVCSSGIRRWWPKLRKLKIIIMLIYAITWSLSEHASIMTLIGSLFGLQACALVQHMICNGRWSAFPRVATGLCCVSLSNTWKLLAKWHERTFFGTIEQYVCDIFLLIGVYVDLVDHNDPGLCNKSHIATE